MDIFAYSMLCFTSLFTLMDPLGVMPVFLQMTEGMSAGERRSIALKSCALTFVILVLFTLCGRSCSIFSGSRPMVSGLREVSSSLKSDMTCCRHTSPM